MQTVGNGKTLIVGLGKTGLSCARYLQRSGVSAAVTDTRTSPPGLAEIRQELPDVALFLGGFSERVFDAAERLVVSPGISVNEPLIKRAANNGVPVVGDIELFANNVQSPVVAITGSNGKSTVTTLIGQMLEQAGKRVAVGGNLGEPALNLLNEEVEVYVLELSSFQLETTYSLKPEASVVLNVSEDHMDRYDDLEGYADTKAKIYQGAKYRVFNQDDALVMQMAGQLEDQDRTFTLNAPAGPNQYGVSNKDGESWLARGDQLLMPVSELLVPGLHNVANALTALAIGDCLSLPVQGMLDTLRSFKGLKHRMQLVAEHNGIRWFNDSKGTNVGACVAALNGFSSELSGQTVLIAGGEGKGADFTPLKSAVTNGVRAVVLIGRDAQLIHEAIGETVNSVFASDMEQAVSMAGELALPGDRVLLSPACASFDMFSSYQERGDVFTQLVGVNNS